MSYILDALKKSEQQRQRGAAPITLATPAATLAPRSSAAYRTGLLALALIAAGVAIGWLRPWQSPPPPPAIVVKPPISMPPPPAPASRPAIVDAPRVDPLAAAPPVQSPPVRAATRDPAPPAAVEPAQPAATKLVAAEATAGEPLTKALSLSELPQAVRQEIPAIAISLHAYARDPKDRVVMINNQMLRQGDLVAPGLRLEQITQEGVVLGYQGYRFQRGVRQ